MTETRKSRIHREKLEQLEQLRKKTKLRELLSWLIPTLFAGVAFTSAISSQMQPADKWTLAVVMIAIAAVLVFGVIRAFRYDTGSSKASTSN